MGEETKKIIDEVNATMRLVLINKLSIKDEVLLNKYEKKLFAIRQTVIAINPIKVDLDFEHL